MRRNVIYLVASLVIVVGTFLATLAVGNKPILGLDLQGGYSVVLSPVGKFKSDSIDVARDIIESRVNGLGISEPEITRQGNDIVVDLPGVKDRSKAEALVGKTAELRFRPVLANLPPATKSSTTTTTTPSTTQPSDTTPTTTTSPATDPEAAARAAVASCDSAAISALTEIPTTKPADDKRKACVVLTTRDDPKGARLLLGPTVMTGNDVDSADKTFVQGRGNAVDMTLKDSGLTKFNKLAASAYGQTSPTDQVAIVLDSIVQSHPQFDSPSFSGPVQISGSFSSDDAANLAKLINYGALPVKLTQSTASSVSPTLGQDQLNAGIAAGIIGLALVAIYMLVFYRLLGLVVIAGLALSGMAIYTLVTFLGQHGAALGFQNLTLTLAGVTGIIVSVGITVDSYIVYYERLKDDVRAGATVRSSVDRAFTRSFRTIVAADLVSLIGAVLLYLIAVGSVRGFAFYLGMSTILDLLIAYFFMHPLVSIMSRNPRLVAMPGVGIAAGLDAREATA